MDQIQNLEDQSPKEEIPEVQTDSEVPLSDFFHLYQYKIQPCPKTYSHDWTQCVYAHPTENARRRDPRIVQYSPTPCPNYKKGVCLKGDNCQYSHGVFERWLHPSMFKTRICAEGGRCQRKCCFFAHSQEELREPIVTSQDLQDSPQKEQQGLGIHAPRMSNSLVRSLGLNPKDHAMINVQKLLKAFQNREQVLQFQSMKNKPMQDGQGQKDQEQGLNQQYAYGLDSAMVTFMGQQFGFSDEQISNLQRQFLHIKENNSFNQVLQSAQTPNNCSSLPFSPNSLNDNQAFTYPYANDVQLSPHTNNMESGLEDIFQQLYLNQQRQANAVEVPSLQQEQGRRILAQLHQRQQLSHQNSFHNQQLSHQNSQLSQNLLAQVQHQNSLKEQQLSHQNSFQDQQLYHQNSRGAHNGLQVFSPDISNPYMLPLQNTLGDLQLQPNLMYDFMDELQVQNGYQNEVSIGNDMSEGLKQFDPNQGKRAFQLKQQLLSNLQQAQEQQVGQQSMKPSINNMLDQQNAGILGLIEENQCGPYIFDNQLQLKPAIFVNKQID